MASCHIASSPKPSSGASSSSRISKVFSLRSFCRSSSSACNRARSSRSRSADSIADLRVCTRLLSASSSKRFATIAAVSAATSVASRAAFGREGEAPRARLGSGALAMSSAREDGDRSPLFTLRSEKLCERAGCTTATAAIAASAALLRRFAADCSRWKSAAAAEKDEPARVPVVSGCSTHWSPITTYFFVVGALIRRLLADCRLPSVMLAVGIASVAWALERFFFCACPLPFLCFGMSGPSGAHARLQFYIQALACLWPFACIPVTFQPCQR